MDCPNLIDLPHQLVADDWQWRPFKRGLHGQSWIGTDEHGRDWLVKMTGSFFALRERVFDSIAQALGLSCQSCVFLTLPEHAEPLRHAKDAEVYQGAITFIQKHKSKPCWTDCELEPWFSPEPENWVRFLAEGRIRNATDLFVGNGTSWATYAAPMSGRNMSSQRTTSYS
jgi:hypothetical protein